MASASIVLNEEHLMCSICLGVFKEPVSTPCGHNYCKSCISDYWDSSGSAQCPMCNENFPRRPKLRVNTEFRDMVDCFTSLIVKDESGIAAETGEVACDFCTSPKLKAIKTCLVCLASYCQLHLAPHQSLKKHKVVEPVSNLKAKVCEKHHKLLEFFCYENEEVVCSMCLQADHAGHKAVPVEQAVLEKKAMVGWMISYMEAMENTRTERVNEMKRSLQQRKLTTDSHVSEIDEVFTALTAFLVAHRSEVTELVKQKQKAADRETEGSVAQLEREATELKERRSAMEKILEQDQLYLLRNCPSFVLPQYLGCLPSTPQFDPKFLVTQDLPTVSPPVYIEMMKKSVEEIEKQLCENMEMLVQGVRLQVRGPWTPPEDKLMMIQQCNIVNVTLDPYTANSKLVVSEDGKTLTFRKSKLFLPYLLGRKFQHLPFVLAKDGFSSGKFYYEVQVSGCTMWLLGVAKESVNREMPFLPRPNEGAWVFHGFFGLTHTFCHPYITHPVAYIQKKLQTVSVFADYEKGEISFYDVDSRTLIYSFTGCTFTETPTGMQALLSSVAGSPCNRPKLYPILGMYRENSNDTLVIPPLAVTT